MVILAFDTSGSRVMRRVACPAWCARGGPVKTRAIVSPANTSTVPWHRLQWHTAWVGWVEGQCPVAVPEVELVPRLLSRAPRRPRGVPYPTKHWGLKKTPALHSFLCCHLELGEWTKPKDSSSEHLQCPLSNTTYSITALTASTSVGGKTSVPKAPQGTP